MPIRFSIRDGVLTAESPLLDEFGVPSGTLTRRAPVSVALRAALDAQVAELDAEQTKIEGEARAKIALGERLERRPAADLMAKAWEDAKAQKPQP